MRGGWKTFDFRYEILEFRIYTRAFGMATKTCLAEITTSTYAKIINTEITNIYTIRINVVLFVSKIISFPKIWL